MNDHGMILLMQGQINAIAACIMLRECYKLFFSIKNNHKFKFVIWTFYYEWQVLTVFTALNISWHVNLLANVLMVFLIGRMIYKGKVLTKFLFSVALCVIWTLVEGATEFIFLFWGMNPYIGNGPIAEAALSKLILFSIIILLYKIIGVRGGNRGMKLPYNIIFFAIPWGSMVVVSDIFYLTHTWHSQETMKIKLVLTLIMLLINVLTIKIYFAFAAKIELAYVHGQQLDLYALYMKEKEKDFFKMQSASHDMKQHLMYLAHLMKEGEINKGICYIDQVVEMDLFAKELVKSGNLAVDSIVNFKAASAIEKKIEFVPQISLPTTGGIRDTDFNVILGNMLDNAIEANENVRGPRYINLKIKWTNNNIFIRMVNSHDNFIKCTKDGDFLTTKRDTRLHGIGLLSIQKVLERYNGMLKCSYNEKDFTTEILIYDTEI